MAPAAPELSARLQDQHWLRRVDAAEALEGLGEDGCLAIGGISKQLNDPNIRVRRAAAHALGQLSKPEVWGKKADFHATQAVTSLARCLADQDPQVRKIAREPLRMLKNDSAIGDISLAACLLVPELQRRLESEDWKEREGAARGLGELGPAALPVTQALARALADEAGCVREAAKASLARLVAGGFAVAEFRVALTPAIPYLTTRLSHVDWRVRCSAAWALGTGGHAACMGAHKLAEILEQDRDLAMKRVALKVLAKMGLAALPALLEMTSHLTEVNEKVKSAAWQAVFDLREQIVAVVGRALTRNPDIAFGIAVAQRQAKRLVSEVARERDAGVQTLQQPNKSHVAAVTELLRLMLDPGIGSEQDCYLAIMSAQEALGKMRASQLLSGFAIKAGGPAVKALKRHLKDGNYRVRMACAEALASLAVAVLGPMELLKKYASETTHEDAIRSAADRILKMLKEAGAIMDSAALSHKAAHEFRALLHPLFDAGEDDDHPEDLFRARKLAKAALQRLVDAGLEERTKADEEVEMLEARIAAKKKEQLKMEKSNDAARQKLQTVKKRSSPQSPNLRPGQSAREEEDSDEQ